MAIHVFLDFDGTISQRDVGDEVVRHFGKFEPLHSELLAGSMSVAQYYHRAVQSFTASATPDTLTAFALEQELDAGAGTLLRWLRSVEIPTYVVSDGFDVYIRPLLQTIEGGAELPVACNVLRWDGSVFMPEFPGASESCSCFCASCKRNAVISRIAMDDVVVYIGDGRSDTCAVKFADIVFAKGTLAAFCTENGIPFHHYRSLHDVYIMLQTRYQQRDFHSRRQAVLARKSAVESE